MIYEYQKKDFEFSKKLIGETNGIKQFRVEFNSFVTTPYEEANKVVGFLFVPPQVKSRKPLIFLHGMGNRNLSPLSWFSQEFARNGIISYLLILPYHFERTPRGFESGKKYLIDDMDDSIEDFRHAVIDIRTSMDFLEKEGFSDEKFSIMGFSFGGMIGTIAMGVDNRINEGVFVVTGGNYRYITWKSLATRLIRKKYETESNFGLYGCTEKKCVKIHKNFYEYIENLKKPMDLDKVPCAKGCFLFDPLTFAHFIKGRKVVLYNAVFDEVIPRKAANELWQEMGKPERHWLFADHVTIILYRKQILNRALKLFINSV